MKQPELGEKIVELRKAKGYTQEELVEKCNINVRTLQRIESGVVTPRPYTIKIIFSALDYNVYESPKNSTSYSIKGSVGVLYNYILDITNLRKHTLRKASVIIILILSIILVYQKFYSSNREEAKTKVRQHIENSNINLTKWYASSQFDSIKTQYLDSANLIIDNRFPVRKDALSGIINSNSIVSWYEFFKLGEIQTIETKSKKMVISDEIAVDVGILLFKGDSYGEKRGTYFCLWHKVNESWQIETEMFNLR